MTDTSDIEVLAGVAGPQQALRARNLRRIGVVVLVLFVGAAASGWLGPRESTATDRSGDLSVQVTFPQVIRAGVDTTMQVVVEGGAPDAPLAVEIPAEVFDRLGFDTIVPAPTDESSRDGAVVLVWEQVRDSAATVTFVGRMPTRAKLGSLRYPVRAVVGGRTMQVEARTWVLP